jgi:oligoendopeptidase F
VWLFQFWTHKEGHPKSEPASYANDGDMADFARMMQKNDWIEGTVGPKKRQGAYCTNFAKSRSPRVYMTYTGTMREVKTLAHELGHAFHSWVMRDMPYFELDYPMTLAETASIFAETVVTDALMGAANTIDEKLSCAWSGAREVDSLLINVASRFDFERELYEQRQQREFSPNDIKAIMTGAWKNWYGDTLTEMNEMFWASKLHFHISEISFYNYPYIFGYLFSLGVYSQRQKLGDKFYDSYVSLLRDTGRMTAEEVASKHLGVDLTQPDFWQDSLKIAKGNVDKFETIIGEAF